MAAVTSEGANVREGGKVAEASGQAKVVGAKKKYRSRSASASSVDSVSSGSYTGSRTMRTPLLEKTFRRIPPATLTSV